MPQSMGLLKPESEYFCLGQSGSALWLRHRHTPSSRPSTICSSPQSRNYGFGLRVGQGQSVAEALAAANGVVEGVFSAEAAVALAKRHGVDMPISRAVHAVVDGGATPQDVITALLARPVGHEFISLETKEK